MMACTPVDLAAFDALDFEAAHARIAGVVDPTRWCPRCGPARPEVRLKPRNGRVRGLRSRGLEQRPAPDPGAPPAHLHELRNHEPPWPGRPSEPAPATIVTPADAYANKIQACRDHGAEVARPDRMAAEATCRSSWRPARCSSIPTTGGHRRGAGTVGPGARQRPAGGGGRRRAVGGGGLAAGTSLALRRRLGDAVRIHGVEPAGAPSMTRGLQDGEPVLLPEIDTNIQGLCPPNSGALNIAICAHTLDGMHVLSDPEIMDAQRVPRPTGRPAEPAGAATLALLRSGRFEGRTPEDPAGRRRGVGRQPNPAQFEALPASLAGEAGTASRAARGGTVPPRLAACGRAEPDGAGGSGGPGTRLRDARGRGAGRALADDPWQDRDGPRTSRPWPSGARPCRPRPRSASRAACGLGRPAQRARAPGEWGRERTTRGYGLPEGVRPGPRSSWPGLARLGHRAATPPAS